jgi:transcriptional regulator with XRE-family HTH domain
MSIPSVEKNKPPVEESALYSRYRSILDMTFGQWLKQKRKERGLTQEELAKQVGVSLPYISKLERDQRHTESNAPPQPKVGVIDKIAKSLGVAVQEARDVAFGPTAGGGNKSGQEPDDEMTRSRFVDELQALGVTDFNPSKSWSKLTPQDMEEILRSVRRQVETIARAAAEELIDQKVRDKGK